MAPAPTPRRPLLLRALKLVAALLVALLVLPYLVTPFYAFGRPVSTLMLARRAVGARVERIWAPLDAIAPNLTTAVIASEDARFCRHSGIDFTELREAIADADALGEVRGASSISQQTAKNLFLWPGRSFVRKLLEAPLALWLDLVLGKRRLFEIYLNVAEWGPRGVFGAEAASRRAFGKSARDLNPREAALLAAALPNPIRRNAARPGPALRRLASVYERRAAGAGGGLTVCLKPPARP